MNTYTSSTNLNDAKTDSTKWIFCRQSLELHRKSSSGIACSTSCNSALSPHA